MDRTAPEPDIERVETLERFNELREEWEQLSLACADATVFSSFPFVLTAWDHFKGPADRLLILLLRRGTSAVAIAPLCVHTARSGPASCRLIRFIAQWGNGDAPRILSAIPERESWQEFRRHLETDYRAWDGIEAAEQAADSPLDVIFDASRYSLRSYPAHPSFFASLAGTWEEFERNLKPKVRQNFKTRTRGLQTLPERTSCECVDEPGRLLDAMGRFIAVEQTGWKKNKSFSLGGDDEKVCFYRDLIRRLGERGGAAFYFLKIGAVDAAASLIFKTARTVSSIHTVYRPEYARFSPGVLLRAEILRRHLGSSFAVYDYLGCPATDLQQTAKKDWATGSAERRHINIYKKNVRCAWYRAGLRAADMLGGLRKPNTLRTENPPAPAARSFFTRLRRKLLRDRSAYLMAADIASGVAGCAADVPLTIRPMTPADIANMAHLLEEDDGEKFRERLAKGKLGFIAESGGTIAHYSWISLKNEFESWSGVPVAVGEHEAYAYTGFTSAEFRGKRIYPAALAYEMEFLRAKGIRRVWIVIGTGNAPSLAAARRVGFRPVKKYVKLRVLGIPVAYCRKVNAETTQS